MMVRDTGIESEGAASRPGTSCPRLQDAGTEVRHLWCPGIVVVDSTGELLPTFGANSDNADNYTRVHNRFLQPLANTGAAVLLVDHLASSNSSRCARPPGLSMSRSFVNADWRTPRK